MTDTAIQIEGRGKRYHIFEHPLGQLKQALLPFRERDSRHFHVLKYMADASLKKSMGVTGVVAR